MKLAQDSSLMGIYYGVVRDGAPCNEDHAHEDSTVGWFMHNYYGSLFGHGKFDVSRAGEIEPGQVVTMQVNTDAGTLKFWVDSKPHSPGYTSGLTGPLRWAISVGEEEDDDTDNIDTVELAPTPTLQ